MIHQPLPLLATLLVILATLFWAHDRYKSFFNWIPLLVWAYFLPTLLSNTGVIPQESPLYDFIKKSLLPASLFLLVLSVDIPAIMSLGKKVIALFLTGTVSVIIGGPLAYLLLKSFAPVEMGEEVWKGLAALCGSWIGGGANFIAIGESVGASDSTISMMVVVDVAIANIWMMGLLYFAGKEQEMDDKIGADRTAIDRLRKKVEEFHLQTARPITLPDTLKILALCFAVTAVAQYLASMLPNLGSVVRGFTWVVLIVTTAALACSFTPLRNLEGAGASKIGSAFLYLLVTTIGAKANFAEVLDVPGLVLIGALWMCFHVLAMWIMRNKLKSPIFFLAVGSKANIGGAASTPIVASAFHPTLAPVGVLLAIGGYVLGTYGAIVCAWLLEIVYKI
jgi:uncharacterized membrane protein